LGGLYLSWFFGHSISDALLEPFEILVEKSLLLKYHIEGVDAAIEEPKIEEIGRRA
jgi:hypothetical protein